MTEMRVTMADVASVCGVSKSLVSRVINNDATLKIPDQTRNKILDEVQRLGYIPDHNARLLAKKTFNAGEQKSISIGYITFTSNEKLGHPYFSHVLEGIIDEVHDNDCELATALSLKELGDNFFLRRMKSIKKMDGLILLGRVDNDVLKKAIRQMAKYIVCMDGSFDSDSDFVGSSFSKTATIALGHLVDTGYKDIGMLTGPLNDRLQACLDYLRSRGIEPNAEWIVAGEYSADTTYERVKELLKDKKPPRALMAWNDEMALGCMKAVIESGFRIPEDVAMIGHDDISTASYAQVPLSTVRIYKEELGRLAVRILLERIKTNRKINISVEVPGKLIIRDSCGSRKN